VFFVYGSSSDANPTITLSKPLDASEVTISSIGIGANASGDIWNK